jgi:hypothetical protein
VAMTRNDDRARGNVDDVDDDVEDPNRRAQRGL